MISLLFNIILFVIFAFFVFTAFLMPAMIFYQGITGRELPKPRILREADERAKQRKAERAARRMKKKVDKNAQFYAGLIKALEDKEEQNK